MIKLTDKCELAHRFPSFNWINLNEKKGVVMEEKEASKKECFICQATSEQKVLIPCEDKNEAKWVCVSCLPPLIHGMHF